jgi:hypothetical protein
LRTAPWYGVRGHAKANETADTILASLVAVRSEQRSGLSAGIAVMLLPDSASSPRGVDVL